MARLNPIMVPMGDRKEACGELDDPTNPNNKVKVRLRKLTALETTAAYARAQELVREYVENPAGVELSEFSLHGERLQITKELCFTVAGLEAMMLPVDGEGDPYTAEELIAMAANPTLNELYVGIMQLSGEVAGGPLASISDSVTTPIPAGESSSQLPAESASTLA